MTMNAIILFIVCTAVNVVLSTIKSIIKSILTVKGNKWVAAGINALTYGFYSYVIILTNIDGVSTLAKMGITAACNFVGVLAVKWVEELARKEKLWKIEMTVPTKYRAAVDFDLRDVPHSYIEISDKHTLFNFYCATQAESKKVKDIVAQYDAKYFVAESKNL